MAALRVLVTGATGFIGNRLLDPLVASGASVRCLTRDPDLARRRWPEREWVGGDVRYAGTLAAALRGCDVAYYLVHGMDDPSAGWMERERAAAETFARAAEQSQVARLVYLGGVQPAGEPSPHLRSRLETGERLRAGRVPCAELRAAMVVGAGSASWTIVRDLAARLPAMVLPVWLEHLSQPVAVDDVIDALVAAARVPLPASRVWDLPGPEELSGTQILLAIAELLGHRPWIARVPVVSPRLSSHWIRWVTRADHRLAAELVEGLTSDLLASQPSFWSEAGLPAPMPFEEAARRALRAEPRLPRRARLLESLAGRLTRSPNAMSGRRPRAP